MKRIVYILTVAVAYVGLMTSCSDFLKEEDKDQIIPSTTEQYEAMMLKEAFLKVSWNYMSDLMTDDIDENANAATSLKNKYKSLYAWQRDVEVDGSGQKVTDTNQWWSTLYNKVLIANYVLEHVGEASGTESQRNNLRGEAYFLRARSYFELVNIYAPIYDAATAATTIGVPLRLDTGVKNTYKRNTLAEVYAQVENDLNQAIASFEGSHENTSLWHPGKKASQLLLSRVALFKGDWDKVISLTTDLINSSPAGLWDLPSNLNVPFVTKNNPEIFHTFGSRALLIVEGDGSGQWKNVVPTIYSGSDDQNGTTVTYGISNDLLNSFLPGDCRKQMYILSTEDGKDVPAKWNSQFSSLGAYSFRLSEAYLNRAEAYANKGMDNEALTDVKELIRHRVTDINQVTFPTDNVALRKFIIDERRREFVGEGMRWYDLKRTTAWYPKQVSHKFTLRTSTSSGSGSVQGTETYLLAPNDPNYTFELPQAEISINTKIEQYGKRIDKVAIKQ